MGNIWYQVETFRTCRITPVQVEKETEAFLTINGRRRAKKSNWEQFFPTWEEAQETLLKQALTHVERCKSRLDEAQAIANLWKELKK